MEAIKPTAKAIRLVFMRSPKSEFSAAVPG